MIWEVPPDLGPQPKPCGDIHGVVDLLAERHRVATCLIRVAEQAIAASGRTIPRRTATSPIRAPALLRRAGLHRAGAVDLTSPGMDYRVRVPRMERSRRR
ncbi:hypothetical protein QJS66_14800 [Kocuria rhizophila]|nr:hypothetical protein QJS66_14800 [Kocuria rhizophila]